MMLQVVSRLLIALKLLFAISVARGQQHECVDKMPLNNDMEEWSPQVAHDNTLLVQWSLRHVSLLYLSQSVLWLPFNCKKTFVVFLSKFTTFPITK